MRVTTRSWEDNAHQPLPGQLRFADPAVVDFTSRLFQATMEWDFKSILWNGWRRVESQVHGKSYRGKALLLRSHSIRLKMKIDASHAQVDVRARLPTGMIK